MMKTIHTLIISVLATVGVLFVLSSLSVGGFTAKLVLSGSMEPTIPTGSVAFLLPQKSYEAGDVITFKTDTAAQHPTTHRIMFQNDDGTFTTRGDANDANDFVTVSAEHIFGKVLFAIPYLGYILDFAKNPLGFILLVGIPATYIILDELSKIVAVVRCYRAEKKVHEPKETV